MFAGCAGGEAADGVATWIGVFERESSSNTFCNDAIESDCPASEVTD